MSKYKKYILEVGPGISDTRRLKIAKNHPDWLICILDNNDFVLKKCRRESKEIPNFVVRKGNVTEPIVGLRFKTEKGDFTVKENTFDQVHAHGIFTSNVFRAEAVINFETVTNYIKKALKNLLAVLKPGLRLYVSGEYGQRSERDNKYALERALEEIGYEEDKDYKISKLGMSALGDRLGRRQMCTYQIWKK